MWAVPMSRYLTTEQIHDKIMPLRLELEGSGGDDEEDPLLEHIRNVDAVINRLERLVLRKARREGQNVRDAEKEFLSSVLIVAGRLIEHDEIIINQMALKIAAIVAAKGGDEAAVRFVIDEYDAKVENALAGYECPQAVASLFLRAMNILLPHGSEQGDYRITVARAAVEAGILLPPDTLLGDRLHEQAVVALHEVSLFDLDEYKGIIGSYILSCLTPETYPGANEIMFHSYLATTEGMAEFIEQRLSNQELPALAYAFEQLLLIDSVFLVYLYDQPRLLPDRPLLQALVVENFKNNIRQLDACNPDQLVDVLTTIQDTYFPDAEPLHDPDMSLNGLAAMQRIINQRLYGAEPGALSEDPHIPALSKGRSASHDCFSKENRAISQTRLTL
jgi:hypothetical protein